MQRDGGCNRRTPCPPPAASERNAHACTLPKRVSRHDGHHEHHLAGVAAAQRCEVHVVVVAQLVLQERNEGPPKHDAKQKRDASVRLALSRKRRRVLVSAEKARRPHCSGVATCLVNQVERGGQHDAASEGIRHTGPQAAQTAQEKERQAAEAA